MTVRQFLRNFQTCGAFIAALTSEKTIDVNQKKFIPPLAIDNEFFVAYFQSLYDVKPKAQSERCAPYCAFGHQVPKGQLLY
jgi:hypothetical protein